VATGGLAGGDDAQEHDRPDDEGPVDGGPAGPSGDDREPRPAATPSSSQVGRVAVLLLAVLFGVFALANAQPVDFSWVFGETRVTRDAAGDTTGGVPLIVLLLSAFVLGAVLGGWWTWQAARSRRRARDARRG
jgi:uncharacterized integral membrane protein